MNDLISKPEKPSSLLKYPISFKQDIFHLSLSEKVICETWLSTNGNLHECSRQVKEKAHKRVSPQTIDRWIKSRIHIQDYLKEELSKRAKVAGFDLNEFKSISIDVINGTREMNPVQAQVLLQFGKLEFYKGSEQQNVGSNVQINILQANGER